MRFTYDGYQKLIKLIQTNGYEFTDYHSYWKCKGNGCCILRHDIDYSVEKAFQMFEVERELGIFSTYYVMLTSDLYNPASKKNVKMLQKMHSGGASIGLHFDEAAYENVSTDVIKAYAERERVCLEKILELPVCSISMHRPTQQTLDENWHFENMVNSYSDTFFHDFKYVSDSRRRWREAVEDIVASKKYSKLHILMHPFWYNEKELDIHGSVSLFVNHANHERYWHMRDNITDLSDIMQESEIVGYQGGVLQGF